MEQILKSSGVVVQYISLFRYEVDDFLGEIH